MAMAPGVAQEEHRLKVPSANSPQFAVRTAGFVAGHERDIETAEFMVADELDITAQLVVSGDSGRAFTLFAPST
jgi:hypothetical protein